MHNLAVVDSIKANYVKKRRIRFNSRKMEAGPLKNTQAQQTLSKPTALRIYLRILRHINYVKQYSCNNCYAHNNSLIIEGDAKSHIKYITGNTFNYVNFDNIIYQLKQFNLIKYSDIYEDLHILTPIYPLKVKGVRHER